MSDSDQKYYDLVAEELEKNSLKLGVWARAVAETGDEGPKAKSTYIKLRVAELKEAAGVNKRVKIGGWLLFYCIALTIIGPFLGLVRALSAYDSIKSYLVLDEVKVYAALNGIYITAILIYSIITGILIWIGRPDGRTLARQYLTIRAISALGFVLIITYLTWDWGILQAGVNFFVMLIGETIHYGIWITYFSKSQRVKLTYGEEPEAAK